MLQWTIRFITASYPKFEIDIYDIPMQALTEQYMQYVHAMKQLEINIASEYLVLASELLMIKSKMLLPQSTSDMDVDDDPREDLVGRLIEYQNYKEYTAILNDMKEERDFYFTKDRQIYLIWKQMNLGIQIIRLT